MTTTPQSNSIERKVHVALGERSYDIRIKPGILAEAGGIVKELVRGRRCMVITDRNLGLKYGTLLASSMQHAGFAGDAVELPPGEKMKVLATAASLLDRCMSSQLDRDSVILALGGGVVGDLAGFVAATFYRGISVVQVPTTLLAMVDAAIGGKTGVDHPMGKNAIGAFHQPKAVLIDPLTLITLPERELKAGLAEVIKYGVIDDRELFELVETHIDKLLAKDAAILTQVIERCAAIKARIVSADERESLGGPRALLNFGHTFAHAIESTTNYEAYLHGEAVAIGMVLAAELSVELGLFTRADRDRLRKLIERAGLPTGLQPGDPKTDALHAATFRDKKVSDRKLRFIVAEKIGNAKLATDVSEELAKKVWDTAR